MVAVKNVTHMNAGDGQNSYANNSDLQRAVISAALPVLDEAVKAMFATAAGDACSFRNTCLRIVDLGCSSGPNTFFAISHILSMIDHLCGKEDTGCFGDELPEFEVFLNDLPDNDFNNLFKMLPAALNNVQEMRKRCSWYGLPGSFHDRLFPSKSLHFAFSCYSMHWLSQIPEGVGDNNKENIYLAKETPPKVSEAYTEQFQRDFAILLRSRSKEMVRGGRMVFIVVGRRAEEHSICSEDDGAHYVLLSKTLLDMVAQGRVKLDDLHSFNVPIYYPCEKEVEAVVRDEGSFDLHKIQGFPVGWDASGDRDTTDKYGHGKMMAKSTRAYMEPMLARHFGNSIMDELFERYAKKAAELMFTRRIDYWNLVISLCRK